MASRCECDCICCLCLSGPAINWHLILPVPNDSCDSLVTHLHLSPETSGYRRWIFFISMNIFLHYIFPQPHEMPNGDWYCGGLGRGSLIRGHLWRWRHLLPALQHQQGSGCRGSKPCRGPADTRQRALAPDLQRNTAHPERVTINQLRSPGGKSTPEWRPALAWEGNEQRDPGGTRLSSQLCLRCVSS